MIQSLHAFVTDENGVTAIEYGLLAAAIALAIVTVMSTVGQHLSDVFKFLGLLGSVSSTAKG